MQKVNKNFKSNMHHWSRNMAEYFQMKRALQQLISFLATKKLMEYNDALLNDRHWAHNR